MSEYTVKVHFIDGSERIVPAKDIQWVGEEGARRSTALVDGKEVPIYKRSEPEWGPLWYEQEQTTLEERGDWCTGSPTCQCSQCRLTEHNANEAPDDQVLNQ